MTTDIKSLENRLLIDQDYIRLMNELEPSKYHDKLMSDLKSTKEGVVILKPPTDPQLFSFYKDIRAWVYGKSKEFHYTVKINNVSDRQTLFDILGPSRVEGSYNEGYRFRFV